MQPRRRIRIWLASDVEQERSLNALCPILSCDDHDLFRAGLRQVLEDLEGEPELLEAADADEAFTVLRERSVGLVFASVVPLSRATKLCASGRVWVSLTQCTSLGRHNRPPVPARDHGVLLAASLRRADRAAQ
jgi:PleD family two-component response regulator